VDLDPLLGDFDVVAIVMLGGICEGINFHSCSQSRDLFFHGFLCNSVFLIMCMGSRAPDTALSRALLEYRGCDSCNFCPYAILVCGEPLSPLLNAEVRLGVCLVFSIYSPLCIPIAGMRGGEQCHAFFDRIAIALGELQAVNLGEALVPFAGSKCGVYWGPSSYSRALTNIVVGSIRSEPTACCLSSG
jgi:hypothetical protein